MFTMTTYPRTPSERSAFLKRTDKRIHRVTNIVPDSMIRGDKPIIIEIPLEPVAKARARTIPFGNGGMRTYTPVRTQEAQDFIRAICLKHKSLCFGSYIPVKLTIKFCRTNRVKHKRGRARKECLPVRKPDLDNFVKLCLDSINGVLVADDAQITTLVCQKQWSDRPEGYITMKLEGDKFE